MADEHRDVAGAESLLAEVGELKRDVRADLQADGWQWLLVWATVCIGAWVSLQTAFGPWYWMVAVPVAIIVTGVVQWRLEGRVPVRRKQWPYWLIGALMTLAGFGVSFAVDPEVSVLAVWVVFGVGFTGFSLLERQPVNAAVFGVLTIAAIVSLFISSDPFVTYGRMGLLFGSTMVAVAIWARMAQRR